MFAYKQLYDFLESVKFTLLHYITVKRYLSSTFYCTSTQPVRQILIVGWAPWQVSWGQNAQCIPGSIFFYQHKSLESRLIYAMVPYYRVCRPISAMFSSNKISQHNKLRIAHALQSFCKVKTDRIYHAQYSNYIAATHSLSVHIKMHYTPTTTHPPLPTPLPSTTLLCTQLTNTKHICVSGGKMAQDVGMAWKCCGVIPI